MYLQSIQLENYRRFKFAQIEFPDGVVGIIGNNGAGKSTLIEAVAWALYGNAAARTGKEDIKRLNSKPQDISRVILDFELQGENYRVVRELRGATAQTDASVLVNSKVSARGITAVTDLIEKTLNMDYRAFITSFYAPQKELNVLSDFSPYKRKEVLARMLGIEKIDSALKNLRRDARDIDLKLEISEVHLKDLKELENRKKELAEESRGYLRRIQEEENCLKAQENSLKMMEEELKKSKEDFEKYNNIKSELSIKNTLLSEFNAQLAKNKKEIERLEGLTAEIESLGAEVKNYSLLKEKFLNYESLKVKTEQRKSLQSQIENYSKSIDIDRKRADILKQTGINLAGKIRTLEKLKRDSVRIEEQLEKTRSEFIQAKSEQKVILQEQVRLQKQLEGIEKLGPDSVCELCLRPMGNDFPKIREHLESELVKTSQRLNKVKEERRIIEEKGKGYKNNKVYLEAALEKLRKEIEALLKEKGEQETLEKNLLDKEKNLLLLRNELDKLGDISYDMTVHTRLRTDLERLEKLKERYAVLNQEKNKLPELKKSLAQIEDSLADINKEIEKLKETLKLLLFSEGELKVLEDKAEKKRAEVHQGELNLKDLYHQNQMIISEQEKIKKDIEDTQKLKQELKTMGEDKLYLVKLDEIMAGFKNSLISRIKPSLSVYTRELFLELTEERYEDLELDDNYEIYIRDQGERFSIERFSGGEKDLANLCLRLAISLLISESSGVEFSFIILDEIFGSQDALRKDNILRGLSRLRNRFSQIFLITHIEDIKDSVENLITVLENEDGTSQLVLQ
ncbi:MAG: SMC family ATPase [candidate division Zixibacteria bacterium]|nr:SMC family ATPase [candidate division Zixibacteria bacterium]